MSRQTREQARRLTWLTEAQAAIGWGIILVLAALLGTIYLRQASQIATIGRHVQIMQNNLASIKQDNATLEQQIAEAQSLERLQTEAQRLGFVQADPDDIEYVVVPNYPADSGETAVVPPTPAPITGSPQTIGEAFWQQISSGVSNLIRGEARE